MTQSTIEDLKALSVAQRLKLIEDLWVSIEAEVSDSLPLPEWHRNEIDRRLDALDAGGSVGEAWNKVRERIVARP
jgi:putative addiction module component (TIGR02574 family)